MHLREEEKLRLAASTVGQEETPTSFWSCTDPLCTEQEGKKKLSCSSAFPSHQIIFTARTSGCASRLRIWVYHWTACQGKHLNMLCESEALNHSVVHMEVLQKYSGTYHHWKYLSNLWMPPTLSFLLFSHMHSEKCSPSFAGKYGCLVFTGDTVPLSSLASGGSVRLTEDSLSTALVFDESMVLACKKIKQRCVWLSFTFCTEGKGTQPCCFSPLPCKVKAMWHNSNHLPVYQGLPFS